jgi:hypothetical protein
VKVVFSVVLAVARMVAVCIVAEFHGNYAAVGGKHVGIDTVAQPDLDCDVFDTVYVAVGDGYYVGCGSPTVEAYVHGQMMRCLHFVFFAVFQRLLIQCQ